MSENYQEVTPDFNEVPFSVWLLIIILSCIPIIGQIGFFIYFIVLAFKTPEEYKYPCLVHFARATLIMMAVGVVLFILIMALFFSFFSGTLVE